MKRIIATLAVLALAVAPAFGQSAPNATGFTGNPIAQVGQHQTYGGNPPVLTGTNCGQAGAPATGVQPGSTDMAGTIINGTATTGCVLTFFQPFNQAPFCIVQDATTAASSAGANVFANRITFGTIVSADILKWWCVGQAGG